MATPADIAKNAARMAEIANEKAVWAAGIAAWAAELARHAALESMPSEPMTVDSNETVALPKTQSVPPTVQSGTKSHQVCGTTELLETILLCNSIDLRQLFSLQRVDRQFSSTISGSIKLRRKMYLESSATKSSLVNPLLSNRKLRLASLRGLSIKPYVTRFSYRSRQDAYCSVYCEIKPVAAGSQRGKMDVAQVRRCASLANLPAGSWQDTVISPGASTVKL